jgi:nanoRNase/pAp phosphatase (c-di-AMP/oligoRNAs hydrolase)
MDFSTDFAKIKDLVTKAQDILIISHENPSFDSVGSSLALSLALKSLGKQVTVALPDQVTVELSSFIGVDKIVNEISKKNFVISLDYTEGSIEKVSYNIEGNKFNLVIEPRPGYENFSEDKVHFEKTGAKCDLIFVIDTIHLGGLKKLYENEKELFASRPVVSLDRHPNNTHFGQINIIDATVAATVELIAAFLNYFEVRLTEDIATNMLNALYGGTANFQSPYITGRTFDLASACIKSGGKKFARTSQADVISKIQKPEEKVSESVPGTKPGTIPTPSTQFQMTQPSSQTTIPEASQPKQTKPGEAPADWLKPKIFKSSNPTS